ncbi:MAG TPA: class I SAM-dependent methyltransferase [Solirubrobacteraceae bacterium]|nr:class I SAM-dependent methyltransferase [Solirubrobacteraceae bacterium]
MPTPPSSIRRRLELLDWALERGLLPDPVLRVGSRSGARRKHSGCLWTTEVRDLAGAEEAMLAHSCERAQVADGMRILDLGCGWGSLSLWLAEHLPGAQSTGVSNSADQREWIESRREALGLRNLTIVTAEVNEFNPRRRFDRVMSIEMFEHMRNWRELLRRIADWLRPTGKAFVHVCSHRSLPYRVEGTWAAERCFTSGVMPSHDLLPRFQEHLNLIGDWVVPGTHYARTLAAWLKNLDAHADEALRIVVDEGRSESDAHRLLGGWRLFLLSAREMWRYQGGNRWLVSHYLLEPRGFRSQPLWALAGPSVAREGCCISRTALRVGALGSDGLRRTVADERRSGACTPGRGAARQPDPATSVPGPNPRQEHHRSDATAAPAQVQAGSSASTAATIAGSSGVTLVENRARRRPSAPTRYLVKFHPGGFESGWPASSCHSGGGSARTEVFSVSGNVTP